MSDTFGVGQAAQAASNVASTALQLNEENKLADRANNTAQSLAGTFTPVAQNANRLIQPYATTGNNAVNQLSNGLTESYLQQTPGYQFNLTQGEQGAANSAAARGLADSGAALRGAATYASGLADSTYQNQFGDSMQLANLGANATQAQGQNLINAQNNSVQTRMAGVGAQMSGMSAMTNSLTNGLNGLGNQAGNYGTNYAAYRSLLNGGTGGTSPSQVYSGPQSFSDDSAGESAGDDFGG